MANGRRAVRHVSSDPSKIPYGGFSPVRLQAGSRRPPSPAPPAYRLAPVVPASAHSSPTGQSPHCVGVEADSVRTLRPRGPWLGVGLCCPVASQGGKASLSLTMASSELLARSGRLIIFAGRSLPYGCGTEGPCFHLRILLPVPPSVPRQTGRPRTIVRPPVLAFARMRGARRLR